MYESRLQRNEDISLYRFGQLSLIFGDAQDKVHSCCLADLLQLGHSLRYVRALQAGNFQEAVKIHLLQIMILRNNTADKADKFTGILNHELGHIDQPDLIVELVHMLGALVQVYNVAGDALNFAIYLINNCFVFPLPLFPTIS